MLDTSLPSDLWTPGLVLCSLAATSGVIVASAVWRTWARRKERKAAREEDFEDINTSLQNDLRNKLLGKINEVKREIKFKKLQKEKNVKHLLKQQNEEIAVKQTQFMLEKLEIETRYKERIEILSKEVADDINHLRESLKSLQIILASSGETADTVSSARSELECPVCLEEMRPPKK